MGRGGTGVQRKRCRLTLSFSSQPLPLLSILTLTILAFTYVCTLTQETWSATDTPSPLEEAPKLVSEIAKYGTCDRRTLTSLPFPLGAVKQAVLALAPLVIGANVGDIRANWATFWRRLTSDSQLRWIGPEKGALHLATGAVVNAIWDLVAKLEGKPLWKLLVDMTPEEIIDVIDFRYM